MSRNNVRCISDYFLMDIEGKQVPVEKMKGESLNRALIVARDVYDFFCISKRDVPFFYRGDLKKNIGVYNHNKNIIVIDNSIADFDDNCDAYIRKYFLSPHRDILSEEFFDSVIVHEVSHSVFAKKFYSMVYKSYQILNYRHPEKYADAIVESFSYFMEDFWLGCNDSLTEECAYDYRDSTNVKTLKHFYLAFHSLARQGKKDIIFENLPAFVMCEAPNVRKHELASSDL